MKTYITCFILFLAANSYAQSSATATQRIIMTISSSIQINPHFKTNEQDPERENALDIASNKNFLVTLNISDNAADQIKYPGVDNARHRKIKNKPIQNEEKGYLSFSVNNMPANSVCMTHHAMLDYNCYCGEIFSILRNEQMDRATRYTITER